MPPPKKKKSIYISDIEIELILKDKKLKKKDFHRIIHVGSLI